MGNKYVKEDETFNTSRNGVVPKPSASEVSAGKYLKSDGTWATPSGGGGGGSTVSITPTLQSGTKIADFEIDSVPGVLYAPSGGGGGAVNSVNGMTGDVVLDAGDVGALPDNTPIPSKTSELQNDSGYITAYQALHEYSTSEKVIGKWIDGKPLYEKTINVGVMIKDTSWHSINHNVLNIDKIIKLHGITRYSNEWYDVGTFRPVSGTGIMLYATDTVVGYMNNYQATDETYIFIQYTKTTD